MDYDGKMTVIVKIAIVDLPHQSLSQYFCGKFYRIEGGKL